MRVPAGYQLVDGRLRLFVLEGPAAGRGMAALVPALARWAVEDQDEQRQQEEQEEELAQDEAVPGDVGHTSTRLPRRVLFNPLIKCARLPLAAACMALSNQQQHWHCCSHDASWRVTCAGTPRACTPPWVVLTCGC
jgi:hypothetical protein